MHRIVTYAALVAILGLVACSSEKKKGQPGPPTPQSSANTKAPAAAPTPAGPFAKWGDPDALAKRLEGTWVVGGSFAGKREAWKVEGNKVIVASDKGENARELEVYAPCKAKVIERSGATTSATHTTFVWDGADLYAGLGSAGLHRDGDVLACLSSGIYVFEGGKCERWEEDFMQPGTFTSEPAQCSIVEEDGKRFFSVGGTMGSKVQILGDTLRSEQMTRNKALSFATFDEAKAARTEPRR